MGGVKPDIPNRYRLNIRKNIFICLTVFILTGNSDIRTKIINQGLFVKGRQGL